MKKYISAFLMAVMLAITIPVLAGSASAQCRYNSRRYRSSYARRPAYNSGYYQPSGYTDRRPSFYRRHRNLVNIGVATGAGALIGGLLGGRRGVGYGLLGGAGAGALYTYKLNPKKRRYYRNY